MLNGLRNHGFRQSADFRIFIKNTVHFFQPALIFDDFDAKNADFFKFCEVNKPVRLFKIMLPRGTPPDSYPH